ncbi:inositol monophosphatase family protein [Gordonia zhaorongruii]|uniref:inositol monophosphatase family protein n=1 Tax=Gordonia zhaorongruii TaxID=2597659 RepID=UPI001404B528|nr:inositol monophosphatase family protein [Gordonia zhaorongruii]
MTDDLRVAFEAADDAAVLALKYFDAGVTPRAKPDDTPVTDADHAVERLLRARLSDACPADGVLGEEFGAAGDASRVWILDPIDGTGYFARRDPNWRVQIALEIDEATVLAVVVSPALGTCWWATAGGGAFESAWPRVEGRTTRLAVRRNRSMDSAVVDGIDDDSRLRFPESARRAEGSALPLIELVRGEIDAFLAERFHKWDHAPWILIVEESGGKFTDRRGGHAADQGGGLYSTGDLHTKLLRHLCYPVL